MKEKYENRGKLDELKVIKIYKATGSTAEIANKFSVNPEEVTRIKKQKAYKYYTENLDPPKEFPFEPGTFTIE